MADDKEEGELSDGETTPPMTWSGGVQRQLRNENTEEVEIDRLIQSCEGSETRETRKLTKEESEDRLRKALIQSIETKKKPSKSKKIEQKSNRGRSSSRSYVSNRPPRPLVATVETLAKASSSRRSTSNAERKKEVRKTTPPRTRNGSSTRKVTQDRSSNESRMSSLARNTSPQSLQPPPSSVTAQDSSESVQLLSPAAPVVSIDNYEDEGMDIETPSDSAASPAVLGGRRKSSEVEDLDLLREVLLQQVKTAAAQKQKDKELDEKLAVMEMEMESRKRQVAVKMGVVSNLRKDRENLFEKMKEMTSRLDIAIEEMREAEFEKTRLELELIEERVKAERRREQLFLVQAEQLLRNDEELLHSHPPSKNPPPPLLPPPPSPSLSPSNLPFLPPSNNPEPMRNAKLPPTCEGNIVSLLPPPPRPPRDFVKRKEPEMEAPFEKKVADFFSGEKEIESDGEEEMEEVEEVVYEESEDWPTADEATLRARLLEATARRNSPDGLAESSQALPPHGNEDVLCPWELLGKCLDWECEYLHQRNLIRTT